jgi:hypothetical protein
LVVDMYFRLKWFFLRDANKCPMPVRNSNLFL